MSRELLKQALEALEEIHPGNMTPMAEEAWNKAITALRQALEQPADEPVAWIQRATEWLRDLPNTPLDYPYFTNGVFKGDCEELASLLQDVSHLKPADEPVATVEDNSQNWAGMDGATAWHLIHRHADGWADVTKMMGEWLAANTRPQPAAQWVGLTDEEINKLRYKKDWTAPWTDMTFARAIEQALKEKNT